MFKKISLFAAICLGQEYFGNEAMEGPIVLLNDANFHTELKNYERFLVLFCKDEVELCQEVVPEFKAAANTLHEIDHTMTLARIDTAKNSKIAEEFGIGDELAWFENGKQ